jgi:hypothetical protein
MVLVRCGSVQRRARKVEHTVQIGVHRLAAPGELHEGGFLAAVALVTLQASDPPADSLRAVS